MSCAVGGLLLSVSKLKTGVEEMEDMIDLEKQSATMLFLPATCSNCMSKDERYEIWR